MLKKVTGYALLAVVSSFSLAGALHPGAHNTGHTAAAGMPMDTGTAGKAALPAANGLLVDLDAGKLVEADGEGRVEKWGNSAPAPAVGAFVKQDGGRKEKGSGRPLLVKQVAGLKGQSTVVFRKEELVAPGEDVFDHLIRGSGYTWLCVIKPGRQYGTLKDVHSFFGNLRNGGHYEGLWAGFADDNSLWAGSRNGRTFGRWDVNNPYVVTAQKLDTGRYYLLAGRMDAGTDTVNIALFINRGATPAVTGRFPVDTGANPSKMAIGQERDAIEHPGVESFVGEIARFMLFGRPLKGRELQRLQEKLMKQYHIR